MASLHLGEHTDGAKLGRTALVVEHPSRIGSTSWGNVGKLPLPQMSEPGLYLEKSGNTQDNLDACRCYGLAQGLGAGGH